MLNLPVYLMSAIVGCVQSQSVSETDVELPYELNDDWQSYIGHFRDDAFFFVSYISMPLTIAEDEDVNAATTGYYNTSTISRGDDVVLNDEHDAMDLWDVPVQLLDLPEDTVCNL